MAMRAIVARGLRHGVTRQATRHARLLSTLPPHTMLPMPALSPTMTSGNLASWKKAEGDAIASGDVIAEIETDKATVDYEAVDEGFLAKILMKEGCVQAFFGRPRSTITLSSSCLFFAHAPRDALIFLH